MIILNESDYISAVLSGDFTNSGVLIPQQNRKYYLPFVYKFMSDEFAGRKTGHSRRKYARAIDECGITNFCGKDFQTLYDQWSTGWRKDRPDLKCWTLLSGQSVELDAVELSCLFSIEHRSQRSRNLIALFLIKYFGLKHEKIKIPYELVCKLCGVKIGDHWDKYRIIRQDMGIIPIRGATGRGNEWRYDRVAMEAYYDTLDRQYTDLRFRMRYDGDYIWHPRIPFEHNGEGLIRAFDSLRRRTADGYKGAITQLSSLTGK